MSKRTIELAVATYRRNDGLAALLTGIAALELPEDEAFVVRVVDNSPDRGAEALVLARADAFPVPLIYTSEPRQGLSRARNTALKAAVDRGATHLAFLDDDEVPAPDWLTAHLAALDITGGAASLGSVHARYQSPPPRWVERNGYLEIKGHPNLQTAPFGATSNIVFALEPVVRNNLTFDAAYDQTGGEDTAFFHRFALAGGRIVFAADAIAYETVPPARATLRWLWRRWRRTGQTSASLILRDAPGAANRAACVAGGILRIGAGFVVAAGTAPLYWLGGPARCMDGVRIVARGLGFIDATAGRYFRDYANPSR